VGPASERNGGSVIPTALPESRPDLGVKRRPLWVAVLPMALVLAVAGGWLWHSPSPQPTVLRMRQVTHFGRVDPISRLATDGARIYFVERQGGHFTLAAVPAEGGEPVPVPTPFPNTALYGISPDHSELLVGSYAGGERIDARLWMLPTTGGSPHPVGNVIGHDAAWSPDGREIAYFSGPEGSSEGVGSDLYVFNPDGSGRRKLATTGAEGWFPRWAPDGKSLRLTAWDHQTPTVALWETDVRVGNLHRLLAGWREPSAYYADGESGGDWTPDGNYFVFRSTRAGVASIWAISERREFLRGQSRTPVQLLTTDSSVWNLLAAKNKIFYTGEKEVRELARYDARSKEFIPYLPGVRARDVSFSRDGQWMAYVVATAQESIL
jgi:WD40 repeat protein